MRKVAPQLSWIEQETSKLKVVGSNPTGATSYDFEDQLWEGLVFVLTSILQFEIIVCMLSMMEACSFQLFLFIERGGFFEENIKENYSSMYDDGSFNSLGGSSVRIWFE